MKHFLYIISFAAGVLALVGRDRHTTETPVPSLQARHKGWKTQFWHDDEGYSATGHRRLPTHTRTVTVTVTVTQPDVPFPPANTTLSNVTAPAGNDLTTTSTNDLAPITLIDINTLPPTSVPSSANSVPVTTPVDTLAPITLIDINTVLPTSVASSEDSSAIPTPNDLAPITLIDINTLELKRGTSKETGKA